MKLSPLSTSFFQAFGYNRVDGKLAAKGDGSAGGAAGSAAVSNGVSGGPGASGVSTSSGSSGAAGEKKNAKETDRLTRPDVSQMVPFKVGTTVFSPSKYTALCVPPFLLKPRPSAPAPA